ncbi:MAG: AMP-binding protein [Paracoccaceae bacterium]
MNLLFDRLFTSNQGSRIFLSFSDQNKPLTYDKFLREIKCTASLLKKLGLEKGDRLVLQIEKSHHVFTIYGACVQLGVIFIPLNTSYTAVEVEYFLKDSECKIFIATTKMMKDLESQVKKVSCKIETIDTDYSGSFFYNFDENEPLEITENQDEDDIAAILYTSGTTGRSKGAMLSQKNLLSNALTLSKSWGFTASDVLLHALPIYHTHGLFVATNIVLVSGSKIRFLKKFNEDDIIANLPSTTVMMGVPTFYTRLLANRKFNKEITKNMRLFISGSAPLLKETHEKFQYLTGHKILERYGMTETNMITSNPYNGERKAGTVGLALEDVKVRVAAPENKREVLKNREIGVVEVMGPNVFKGYWKQPEKTKSEFRDDGFFITGDMGYLDKNNYLTIVGRNKDLIITGGLNVYPKEIETVIDTDSNVEESAVIGVSHSDFGEGIIAIIVEKKGHKIDPQILHETLQKNLAAFKLPKKLHIVKELPRNTMGKVQKNVLRNVYKDEFRKTNK